MRVLLFCLGLLLPATAGAQVVISEVMWAGTEVSSADEWLRVVNISDENVSLDGWSITKRGSDGGQVAMILFEEDAELSPGQVFLISNYPASQSALTQEPDLVTSSVSLTNTKLLLQVVDSDGEVIDTVDDGVGVPMAGGKDPFSVMTRIDLHASGEEKTNWNSVPLVPLTSSSSSSLTSLSSESSSQEYIKPQVIISEILTTPKEGGDYEWIEIANVGDTEIDIQNWMIKVGSRSHKILPRNADGYVLKPDEETLFFRHQTGLNLPSSDGQVFLLHGENIIDDLPYSSTGEEVSFGRTDDGSRAVYCIPSPREKNRKKILAPEIITQSGRSTDYTKVTLNLKAEVPEGSLKSAECFWDFKDGTNSKSCNPPSHSWDHIGVYVVELTVKTVCGDEIIKKHEVVVLQKKKKQSASRQISFRSASSSISPSADSSFSDFTLSSSALIISNDSKGEQIMYTTITSSSVNSLPIPIRYENIPEVPEASSSSSLPEAYERLLNHTKRGLEPPSSPQTSGFPWVLLFTQSAVFVGVAGWKMIA
jgi:hypothetical protein